LPSKLRFTGKSRFFRLPSMTGLSSQGQRHTSLTRRATTTPLHPQHASRNGNMKAHPGFYNIV
jgi:hypothetical protein